MNSKFFKLRKEEWLILAGISLVLVLLFFALQSFSPKPVSIAGEPHFESSIGRGELKNPLAVAIYKNIVAVTSSDEASIKIFSVEGKLIKQIKIAKSYPSSLAFNDNGMLFVGDLANKAIYKIQVLLNSKVEKLKLKSSLTPQAIAVLNGNLFVYDGAAQKLKIIKADLRTVDFIKDKSFKLSYANGIYADGNNVYISDSNGRRVLKLDASGNYHGTLKNFSLPRGVAVDSLSRLHVVDTFAHTVKVFAPEGRILFNYGSEGSEDINFYFPNGLAIDSIKGKIYITDKGNSRLQVWGW